MVTEVPTDPLEFHPWTAEVETALVLQAARLRALACHCPVPERPHVPAHRLASTRQLEVLLRAFPATNPWGHPPEEC